MNIPYSHLAAAHCGSWAVPSWFKDRRDDSWHAAPDRSSDTPAHARSLAPPLLEKPFWLSRSLTAALLPAILFAVQSEPRKSAPDPPDSIEAVVEPGAGMPLPRLNVSPAQLHFGGLVPGESRVVTMHLTHSGATRIEIDSAVVPAGSHLRVGLAPSSVRPGHTAHFPVTFTQADMDPRNAAWAIHWSVPHLGHKDTLVVPLTSSPLAPLQALPGGIYWESGFAGAKFAATVSLHNQGRLPLRFSFPQKAPGRVLLSSLPLLLWPGQATPLQVTWLPRGVTVLSSHLPITYRVAGTSAELLIPMRGAAHPPLEARPSVAAFGEVDMGGLYSAWLAVANRSEQPMLLRPLRPGRQLPTAVADRLPDSAAWSDPDWISIPDSLVLPAAATVVLPIQFAPQESGAYHASLRYSQWFLRGGVPQLARLPALTIQVTAQVRPVLRDSSQVPSGTPDFLDRTVQGLFYGRRITE